MVLKRLGHNVRILERNPTPLLHNQGAGVVAGGDTQDFFHRHDATQRAIAVTSRLRHYLDLEGNVIHSEQSVQKMTSWDLLYYILMANFDRVESEYCKLPEPIEGEGEAKYEYGHLVTGLDDRKDQVEIHFKNRDGKQGRTSADLVIGADGPSSTMRKILLPDVKRQYAGYVAWRGTIPETEASATAKEAFVEKFAFYHSPGVQILAYTIPGPNGALEPRRRLINWVWYTNYPEDSREYADLMTDSKGNRHRNTLPIGSMRAEIWQQQRAYAERILPPQFAEIVTKTQQPFIQAITDVVSPRNAFFDGKVLLIGDALAGFRPHTAASTSQAAFDALKLQELMTGKMSREGWERETMDYARQVQERGVALGERSQFGRHPLARGMA